jgi:uncharacterized protein YmfQ (DUF2313 family)
MQILEALLRSLPPVSYDPAAATVQAEFKAVEAPLQGVANRAAQLRVEHEPATAQLALPDWERVLGLPDPCAGLTSSFERRRADVVSKFTALGSLAAEQLVSVAQRLGHASAQVEEFSGASCDSACDVKVYDPATWRFVWALRVAGDVQVEAANCGSPCDVVLARWGDEPLFCAIERYKPAHTVGLILYGDEVL